MDKLTLEQLRLNSAYLADTIENHLGDKRYRGLMDVGDILCLRGTVRYFERIAESADVELHGDAHDKQLQEAVEACRKFPTWRWAYEGDGVDFDS